MKVYLKEKLTELLIKSGLLDAKKLEEAVKSQRKQGGSLSRILIDAGYIKEKDLMILLSRELGVPLLDLSRIKVDPEAIFILPKRIAQKFNILPISKMGDTVSVAMSDPLNIFAIDELEALTGCEIRPVLASEKDIKNAIDLYYNPSSEAKVDEIMKDMVESKLKLKEEEGEDPSSREDLYRLTLETPVIKLVNMILSEAIKLKASDALIEPMEDSIRFRYRIDGVLIESQSPPRSFHNAIVSRIKVLSKLDIAEHRLPQDGSFRIKFQKRNVDFRVSVLPSNIGEKVALRVLDRSQAMLDLERLGFGDKSLSDIQSSAKRPHGMILVCGPTGSGKTTTLYSILKYVDSPEKNIITVEDPVEYEIEGINQVSANPDIGLTFEASLRSILRQDPDIIMIGEIRDYETVDIAIKAALTGHLVLSTLHTTDACSSIVRLVNMGVEPFLITSSVLMVAAQRLIRLICQDCKEKYDLKLEHADIERLGIHAKGGIFKAYRGKGCSSCHNTGYKGRTGIIETLVLSNPIKKLIARKAPEADIRKAALELGMLTIYDDGIEKAKKGLTSVEEVLRVTADRM
ncbi:MAG: hypothetical protein AUJ75_02075 [Candidatus Omnitrophica bacterium CG1_02_49_10]|nr:MAG: hypothetical protein AUJ75_02075 [Candidatus Omnitrophica bacterium CG1_02_49_10]